MAEPLHRSGTEQSDQRQNSKGEAERLTDDDWMESFEVSRKVSVNVADSID
jgi:hypothetical protein